jgi:Zn-dependent peptidase ImmA (M78 family)
MTRPTDVQIFARSFLARYGLDCLDHVDLLASKLGLQVKEVNAETFEGALLRVKDHLLGTILISDAVHDQGRRRFTLAHELAHYVLPGHGSEEGYCRGKKLDRWSDILPRLEREANEFAAEILMPIHRILDLISGEPSFEVASSISQRCGSSLSASAFRLAELTTHRFAIVWSEDGVVLWSKSSKEFEFRVKRGVCSDETMAFRCFSGKEVPNDYDLVPASAWLYDQNLKENASILEHSRLLPAYAAAITFLYVPMIIEEHSKFGDMWE